MGAGTRARIRVALRVAARALLVALCLAARARVCVCVCSRAHTRRCLVPCACAYLQWRVYTAQSEKATEQTKSEKPTEQTPHERASVEQHTIPQPDPPVVLQPPQYSRENHHTASAGGVSGVMHQTRGGYRVRGGLGFRMEKRRVGGGAGEEG